MTKLSFLIILSIASTLKASSIYPPDYQQNYAKQEYEQIEMMMDDSKYDDKMTISYDKMDSANKHEMPYASPPTTYAMSPTTQYSVQYHSPSQSEYPSDYQSDYKKQDHQPKQQYPPQSSSSSLTHNVPHEETSKNIYDNDNEMNVYENQPSAPSSTYNNAPYEQSSSDNDMKMNEYEKPSSSSSYQSSVVIMECKEHLTVVDGDCSKYKTCANGILNIMSCPDNLVFDSHLKICNRPESVSGPCGAKQSQQYQNY